MVTIVLDGNSTEEQYSKLYSLKVGDVFKVSSDYETVLRRIGEYCPIDIEFKVFPINPGTNLYILYGPDHCIITHNHKLD